MLSFFLSYFLNLFIEPLIKMDLIVLKYAPTDSLQYVKIVIVILMTKTMTCKSKAFSPSWLPPVADKRIPQHGLSFSRIPQHTHTHSCIYVYIFIYNIYICSRRVREVEEWKEGLR